MSLRGVNFTERVTGAAMDRPLPRRRPNYLLISLVSLVLLGAVVAIARLVPRGVRVEASDLRIATVHQGIFRNEILVRSTAEALRTVVLDSLESGRVEEILVTDGVLVKEGELLFRLSNPQLRLDLVAREADRAQQISNLSNLRVLLESSQTDHQRRLLEMQFAVAQTRRQHERNALLVTQGFIAAMTLEDSRDKLAQQAQALADEQARFAVEARIKRQAVRQMEQAIQQLDSGLEVVHESIDALAVRAPSAGRLTDFHLQVGQIVESQQHIGRIDDPSQFKLVADVDEYYLGSVLVGKMGHVIANGREYVVIIRRVFPQVTNGRFSIELAFNGAAPEDMSPGQSLEMRLALGEARAGLILPNDAFLNDSGGNWVFVLDPDGRTAQRRTIRIGRHNDTQLEVLSGLAPAERVIVSAYAPYVKVDRLEISR
jgi:HlyD family secretion protein